MNTKKIPFKVQADKVSQIGNKNKFFFNTQLVRIDKNFLLRQIWNFKQTKKMF